MKSAGVLVLILVLLLTASSCSKGSVADKKGSPLNLTYSEIESKGREGFFVLNEDDTFTPVLENVQGYAGELQENEQPLPNRYLWFTNNEMNISNLIPVVTSKKPLVAIFNTNDSMPLQYTLERYNFKGYTIGAHVIKGDDNRLSLSSQDYLEGSDAQNILENISDEDLYSITAINGSKVLPVHNIDRNMALLLGLEQGKYYDFTFYKGTQYETASIIADTLVFQSDASITLKNPFTRTERGYFTINMPNNLSSGYYYICGVGLFQYQE